MILFEQGFRLKPSVSSDNTIRKPKLPHVTVGDASSYDESFDADKVHFRLRENFQEDNGNKMLA